MQKVTSFTGLLESMEIDRPLISIGGSTEKVGTLSVVDDSTEKTGSLTWAGGCGKIDTLLQFRHLHEKSAINV